MQVVIIKKRKLPKENGTNTNCRQSKCWNKNLATQTLTPKNLQAKQMLKKIKTQGN